MKVVVEIEVCGWVEGEEVEGVMMECRVSGLGVFEIGKRGVVKRWVLG